MKKKILYYFLKGDSDGGSDHSLFTHLINLDSDIFEHLVIFRKHSPIVKTLETRGLITIHLPSPIVIIPNRHQSNKSLKKRDPYFKKYLRTIKLFINALPEAFRLRKIIKKYQIDLLHLNHNLNGDRAGIIAGIITQKKIISHNRGLHKPIQIDVILSRFVHKIICISDFVKDEYVSNGIDIRKCITIRNGVDIERFKPGYTKLKRTIVGCIGRLEDWKGQQVLIKAVPRIIEEFPDIKFQFIGSGSNKNNLIKQVEELNIQEYVEFLGSVSNINEIIEKFTIAVHTSIQPEPFGRVIIEAMALGKPVIATNIGGPKEIITDGIDGFLIEPNNTEILSQKIIDLLHDKDKCDIIGAEARKKIINNFNAKSITKKIEKIYNDVLK